MLSRQQQLASIPNLR